MFSDFQNLVIRHTCSNQLFSYCDPIFQCNTEKGLALLSKEKKTKKAFSCKGSAKKILHSVTEIT